MNLHRFILGGQPPEGNAFLFIGSDKPDQIVSHCPVIVRKQLSSPTHFPIGFHPARRAPGQCIEQEFLRFLSFFPQFLCHMYQRQDTLFILGDGIMGKCPVLRHLRMGIGDAGKVAAADGYPSHIITKTIFRVKISGHCLFPDGFLHPKKCHGRRIRKGAPKAVYFLSFFPGKHEKAEILPSLYRGQRLFGKPLPGIPGCINPFQFHFIFPFLFNLLPLRQLSLLQNNGIQE